VFVQSLTSYGFGSKRNIPSLDGLRAISISLVLCAHLNSSKNFPFSLTWYPGNMGVLGVRVFFVISGYLITSALLRELSKTGTIDLPRFYFRRGFRLFPAAWVYITIVAILASRGVLSLHRHDLLFAYTYLSDYYDARSVPVAHLWSLAVEEQFYLLWPIGLKLLGRLNAKRFLIALICAAPFFRLASIALAPSMNFLLCSDYLAGGCLLAMLEPELEKNDRFQKFMGSRWIAATPFVGIAANCIPSIKVLWLVGETIQNVCIALCVFWAVRNARSLVGRVLNLPLISFIGVLSYSLYLWQQLFSPVGLAGIGKLFPANLALALVCALASYVLVEVPFLRLRGMLEPKWFAQKVPVQATDASATAKL